MDNEADVSRKIQDVLVLVHHAFMQPQKDEHGNSLRREAWLQAWSEIKGMSSSELQELISGIETTYQTLRKLNQKIEQIRIRKVKDLTESHTLGTENEWEEDDFLDSSANLPVFNPKNKKPKGKTWVITQAIERPKTTIETCQAIWVTITNRAIYVVDKGKTDVTPNPSRDIQVEKQRLAVLPNLLDDKVVADQLTGKPIMNMYQINHEVKEALIWLLAERAKRESVFQKLFIRFLKKEIIDKAHMYKWANRYSAQAQKILEELV